MRNSLPRNYNKKSHIKLFIFYYAMQGTVSEHLNFFETILKLKSQLIFFIYNVMHFKAKKILIEKMCISY